MDQELLTPSNAAQAVETAKMVGGGAGIFGLMAVVLRWVMKLTDKALGVTRETQATLHERNRELEDMLNAANEKIAELERKLGRAEGRLEGIEP